MRNCSDLVSECSVIEARTTAKEDENPFREVSSRYIRISGKLSRITLHSQEKSDESTFSPFALKAGGEKIGCGQLHNLHLEEKFVDRGDTFLWALLVARSHRKDCEEDARRKYSSGPYTRGLILCAMPNDGEGKLKYRRVGIFYAQGFYSYPFFDLCRYDTVEIV